MSLALATGSNLGNRKRNLQLAKDELASHFQFIEESNIYTSKAVDYQNQPDFYNQVLIFESPDISPNNLMTQLLAIEAKLGRVREVIRGPRIIDIDMLFFDNYESNTEHLTLPHPRLFDRSFVVLPLMELHYYKDIKHKYDFHTDFDNSATILDRN